MTQRRRQYASRGPIGGLIGILIMVGFLWLLFSMVKGIWAILSFAAPIFLIVALVLNRHVVFDYVKNLWALAKREPIKGVIYGGLSFIGFPILSAYFFFRAFMTSRFKGFADRKVKEQQDKRKYADFEEVEDEDDFLELPDLDDVKVKEKMKDSGYENLFD